MDIQGFKRPTDRFVLKELSIIAVKSDKSVQPPTFVFAPPCAWRVLPMKYRLMNAWLERHFHGIAWNTSGLPYEFARPMIKIILSIARTIYVKGEQKKMWLSRYFDTTSKAVIIDLEMLGCPSVRKLPRIRPIANCMHHCDILKYNCAAENVKSLKNWLNIYQTLCDRQIF